MTDGNQDAYEHTRYYALPIYIDTTPFDLRDGYNRAMELIDRKLHQLDTQIAEHDIKETDR